MKTEEVSVPIEQWGKDHWSCLAFLEVLCVDHHGTINDKHRRNLRCNPQKHPGGAWACPTAWKPEYGSRLKGYWKEKSVDASHLLLDHDDWDCIEDFEAAGVLTNGSGLNPIFKLTEKGLALTAALRAHKANGGHFATFDYEAHRPGLALECRRVASLAVPLVMLLLLTGCFSYYPMGTPANPTSQAVLNNTPFLLDIYQDGVCIGKNVQTGQLVPVRPTIWQRLSCVTVTGYTTTGVYMGANTYTFEVHAVETWSVNKLEIPRP